MKQISILFLMILFLQTYLTAQIVFSGDTNLTYDFKKPDDISSIPDTFPGLSISSCPTINYSPMGYLMYDFFDTTGFAQVNPCQYFIAGGTPANEKIFRFTSRCSNTYILDVRSGWTPLCIGLKKNPGICDTLSFVQIPPYQIVSVNPAQCFYYMNLDSNTVYDICFSYYYNPWDIPQYVEAYIKPPTVSNISVSNITSNSLQISWSGTSDNTIVEYGPKGFIPGNDSMAGINGVIISNAHSPLIVNNLIPDSVYNFYLRSLCGIYFSDNSIVLRQKTAIDMNTIGNFYCNQIKVINHYSQSQVGIGSWNFTNCGNIYQNSREAIYKFIPDTTGIFNIHRTSSVWDPCPEWSAYYKPVSSGWDETGWNCIIYDYNYNPWNAPFGPLLKDTAYYVMIKSSAEIDLCGAPGFSTNNFWIT
ncbi:MAG: fibronectin type III domain-containing protein, partial [Bacteroidota bacterium]